MIWRPSLSQISKATVSFTIGSLIVTGIMKKSNREQSVFRLQVQEPSLKL